MIDFVQLTDLAAREGIERIGVGVVVRDASGRVLLVRRSRPEVPPGLWAYPGDHRPDGETVPAAAARVLAEETGLTGLPLEFARHLDSTDRRGLRERRFVFTTTVPDGTEVVLSPDHDGHQWAHPDALPPTGDAQRAVIESLTRHPAGNVPGASRTEPPTLVVGVHLVLLDNNTVLLGRRRNTTYANGLWHLPAGHMEPGETITRSMAREAEEELGILVSEDALALVHALHHRDAEDGRSRLQLFFRPARYDGRVRNAEPHKCEALRYWPLDALPVDIVPYTAHALDGITRGSTLSTVGWPA